MTIRLIVLALLLTFLHVSAASAQDRGNLLKPDRNLQIERQQQNRIRDNIEKNTPEMRATGEAKARLAKKRATEVYGQNMFRKLSAAISRLEQLINKIENRLSKLQEENPEVNLTAINSDIDSAKNNLENAKITLENIKVLLDSMAASDEPKNKIPELRSLVTDIKTELQQTHRLLVKVVGGIKGLRTGSGQ